MPLQMKLLCFLCIAKMNFVDTDYIFLVTVQISYYSKSGVPKHIPGASPTVHILHVSFVCTPISGLGVATNELMT